MYNVFIVLGLGFRLYHIIITLSARNNCQHKTFLIFINIDHYSLSFTTLVFTYSGKKSIKLNTYNYNMYVPTILHLFKNVKQNCFCY